MLQPQGFALISDYSCKKNLSFTNTVETQGGHQVMNMNLRRFSLSSCNGVISKLQILSYNDKLNTSIWFNCFSGSQSKLHQNDLLNDVFCNSFWFTKSIHSFCVLLIQFPLTLTSYIAMVCLSKLIINLGTLWSLSPHTSLGCHCNFLLIVNTTLHPIAMATWNHCIAMIPYLRLSKL